MLTEKQERFTKNIAEGMSQIDAYRSAYNAKKMSDNAAYREASLLIRNPKVAQRLQELRDMMAGDTIMTAKERKEWLTKVIKDEEQDINARLKASDQLNKMDGEYLTRISGEVSMKLEDLL